ncbi:MAG: hypothetical protein CM1200mP34_2960 [Verrucomicrobiales bacterium]|nr:MAG: hypothetical protein CM1200mP34_2960 [Verrucomicrobiales bacterium]
MAQPKAESFKLPGKFPDMPWRKNRDKGQRRTPSMSDGFVRVARATNCVMAVASSARLESVRLGCSSRAKRCGDRRVCPHVGDRWARASSRTEGVLPLHGWPFDLRTGQCETNPKRKVDCLKPRWRAARCSFV